MNDYAARREGLLNYLLANFRDGLLKHLPLAPLAGWHRRFYGFRDRLSESYFALSPFTIIAQEKSFALPVQKEETSMLQKQNADELDAEIPEFIVMDLDGPTNENPLRVLFPFGKERYVFNQLG